MYSISHMNMNLLFVPYNMDSTIGMVMCEHTGKCLCKGVAVVNKSEHTTSGAEAEAGLIQMFSLQLCQRMVCGGGGLGLKGKMAK